MAAFYTFEDLSGSSTPSLRTDNPYTDLIQSCQDDPAQIQARYATHRLNRNAQQQAKLLAPDFPGVTIDEILARLEDPTLEPGFQDWRHCLVFWARPPARIRTLIAEIQQRLRAATPHLWLTAPAGLHMTALEITHSRRADEIEPLVAQLQPHLVAMTEHTVTHRARLVKPLLNFDAQALALSFVPAKHDDREAAAYTYHHLRRDLCAQAQAAGVTVASRYVIPSAHLTIARFVTRADFTAEKGDGGVDQGKMESLVRVIEGINGWLQREYWAEGGREGAWVIGEEKGLECRKGTLWYGDGGETVRLGKGV